jgi:DNA-binding response OmpR family regulator
MLTARTTDRDKLTGLNLGADDYVTKPFSPRELSARVRAVLRRLPGERGPNEIKQGELILDFNRHEAFLSSKALSLTPVEFKLLSVLAKEPDRVFSRGQLIEKAMGYDFDGFDRTVDVHILNLRRKLKIKDNQSVRIKTVYGAGYKLSIGEK